MIYNTHLSGGVNTKDADATASDILTGKTAYVGKEKVTGEMPDNGAVSKTLSTTGSSYKIPKGYHNGSGKVSVSMTDNGAVSQTLSTNGSSYTIPKGYHNGSGKVTANITNLTAENIKSGVTVGGVTGTYQASGYSIERTFSKAQSFTVTHSLGRVPTGIAVVRKDEFNDETTSSKRPTINTGSASALGGWCRGRADTWSIEATFTNTTATFDVSAYYGDCFLDGTYVIGVF